jgi:hypothetical protein
MAVSFDKGTPAARRVRKARGLSETAQPPKGDARLLREHSNAGSRARSASLRGARRAHRWRRAWPGLVAGLALAAAAPSASLAAGMPPQGLYEACAPTTDAASCTQHLQTMGRAGFQVVLNYRAWSASPQQVLGYANAAQALGVKVIWPLDDPAWRDGAGPLSSVFPDLRAGCGCSGDDGFLSYAVNLVKDLPATWGYYIGDEVPADQLSQVQALSAKLGKLDPNHPRLLIADGTSVDPAANLAPFGDVADVVGSDVYPVGWPVPSADVVGSVAAVDHQIASSHGRQAAVALQAFSWSQDPSASTATEPRWPTEQEMQAMRDAALAEADPALILWFSYPDIISSDDPAGHWQDLVSAAFAKPALPPASSPVAATGQSTPPPERPETAAHARLRAVVDAAPRRHGPRHRRHRRRD